MRAAAWPPYGPPAPQGDGRSMLLPYTRPALPAWYTCGRMYRYTVAALRRGDTLDGGRPPGRATGRSRGTINRAVGVMNDAPTQDPNGVLIRH